MNKLKAQSRNTEVNALARRLLGAYRKTALNNDSHLANLIAELEQVVTLLTAAINRLRVASALDEKDELRDNSVRSLYYFILGITHHPDLKISESAKQLFKLLEHYGLSITGENYASESSFINSLLNDLNKPDAQSAIADISGASELIATIQTAQTDFEQTRIAYEEEKAQQGNFENATNLKMQLVKLINEQLLVYLQAMMLVNESTYGEFGRTVAEIISTANEAVNRRSSKPDPAN